MSTRFDRNFERIASRVSPQRAAAMDWTRPYRLQPWGGPLNGQHHRQQIVRELARAVAFDVVLETGTYRGASTAFFAAVTGAPIETVEAVPRFHEYARRRFTNIEGITLHLGDSRSFLRSQAERYPNATALIYLDAHWKDDLPLAEEMTIIAERWPRSIVLIDDFEVPGDPGYEFDDYGSGMALTASYLPDLPGWALYYPSLPSAQETGAKRGCAVVVPAEFDAAVRGCPSLRPA